MKAMVVALGLLTATGAQAAMSTSYICDDGQALTFNFKNHTGRYGDIQLRRNQRYGMHGSDGRYYSVTSSYRKELAIAGHIALLVENDSGGPIANPDCAPTAPSRLENSEHFKASPARSYQCPTNYYPTGDSTGLLCVNTHTGNGIWLNPKTGRVYVAPSGCQGSGGLFSC